MVFHYAATEKPIKNMAKRAIYAKKKFKHFFLNSFFPLADMDTHIPTGSGFRNEIKIVH